ncbi:alpha/beta hydrolase [Acinetobacter soli]|uniref:alpha/beta hydrolase n=1 Tax=Acinetobacter soli TaxID=487316 RepID=UPI003A8540E3
MKHRYIMCSRKVEGKLFIPEPGETLYLKVPSGKDPLPEHAIEAKSWFNEVQKASVWGRDSKDPTYARGDILFFVHGYNNDQKTEVMLRHDQLNMDLEEVGFKGVLVSYDWPSDNKAIAYLEDRHDAKKTAMQLVTDAIAILAERQQPGCHINIHLLAHSMGALVVREAFDDADDCKLQNNSWMISQLIFLAGDVSSDSMSAFNPTSESIYRHCIRLTNYSNLYDSVLKLSSGKRVGLAPRVGRVGLPENAPVDKAVNVDCSEYYNLMMNDKEIYERDQKVIIGYESHSWFIGNKKFTRDLFETLIGDYDRSVIAARRKTSNPLMYTLV